MRDLREINLKPARPAPTDAQVADFEAHFGVSLPADYLTMLRHANGGGLELNCFQPTAYDEGHL
jgi:hypothetical protein